MKKNRLLLMLIALLAFGPTAWAQLTGSGTSESPYLIANESDWNTLATNVNDGTTTYSGKHFKLMDNISVTTIVGGDGSPGNDQCFSGIFDGNGKTITFNSANATEQYIAPFRRINNATVKNLKVTGTVSSNERFAGGIVAYAKGNSTVTDCMNSTSITCVNKSGASNGGIVGMVGASGTLTISGCVFNGQMSGTSSTDWCGILGLCNNNCTANISNCLFDPASAEVNGYTLYRNNNATTSHTNISNCYYTQSMTHNQGKQAYTISSSDVSVAFAGNPSSNTTIGVIGYNPGIKYNDVLYAGEDDYVSLSLTAPLGYKITTATYKPVGGSETTINPVDDVYSFTMPNANVIINAETAYREDYWAGDGSSDRPFQIATTDDFDMLSRLVREVPQGHPFRPYVAPDLIFYGYYFKLMNDLDYSNKTFTPVGYYSLAENIYRGFRGTFDGQGHVIKGINYETTTGAAGIFGFATGDISNLALINSNLTGGNNTGGIVGYYNGGTISNCHVASNVNIYTPTGSTIVAFHGGIVGRKYAGIISYCTSAAHIVDGCTTYGNHFGGIAGSNDSQSINHCLFTNDIVTSVYTDNKGPIAGSNNGSLTNCYWTNSSFEGSSPSTDNDNSGFINTINALQSRMTVATYSPAFKALAPNGYTLQKSISEWTNDENGWYLIASPVVDDIAPVAVVNLIGSQMAGSSQYDFDLYRFNQSPAMSSDGKYKEWENYHQHNTEGNPFRLENGKGYLYARSEETTLTFTGTFNTSTQQEVELIYDPNSPHSDTRGWNLVGNPFGVTAYINKEEFYRMNDSHTDVILAESIDIAPMEGIFVNTEYEEGETVTFSTQVPGKGRAPKPEHKQIVLNLSRDRGSIIDRAIVRMDEGQTLPKFQIRQNSTKLYIPQGGKDYAIAYSDGYGEMSVNFRANEDGEYTITVNSENVEMSYLHLIDNMTGADVDLLQNPSYSFNATTTDYESRFKLVFSANTEDGPSTGSGTFAFYSNGSWVIANEGEATLQVVDLMGRILSSETVNGSVSKAINTVPGVYMIRLINGENVKVQKVIIE